MTGNKKIDTILVAISTLASLVVLGIFIYTEMVFKKELPQEQAEREEFMADSKKLTVSDMVKLDKMIINIRSNNSRLRFLDLQAHLVPFKNKQAESIEKEKAIIQDIFIDIAARMQPTELNSISGKILLESRLKKRINTLWEKPIVKEIFFSKFVIQ